MPACTALPRRRVLLQAVLTVQACAMRLAAGYRSRTGPERLELWSRDRVIKRFECCFQLAEPTTDVLQLLLSGLCLERLCSLRAT